MTAQVSGVMTAPCVCSCHVPRQYNTVDDVTVRLKAGDSCCLWFFIVKNLVSLPLTVFYFSVFLCSSVFIMFPAWCIWHLCDRLVQWLMGKVTCSVCRECLCTHVWMKWGVTAGGLAWLVIGRQLWSPQEVVWRWHSGWEVYEIVLEMPIIDETKNMKHRHDDELNK